MNDNKNNIKEGSSFQDGKYVFGNYRTYAIGAIALLALLVTTSFVIPSSGDESSRPISTATTSGTINGHEYVDLGLSVKWATCNVGASSPTEYGNYYAWGETSTKSTYTEENSKTYGKNFGDINGNPFYDAARVNWGGSWRLPTKAEFKELLDNCKSEWTTQGGVKGRRFTSKKNGKSIFIPAAGWRISLYLDSDGEYGSYWSSTPYENDMDWTYLLNFSGSSCFIKGSDRLSGLSVRPVSE